MEKIKQFIESYARAEAEARTLLTKPEKEKYNNTVEKMYSYTTESLSGGLGLTKIEKLKDDEYYELYRDSLPKNPRHLFKISKYRDEEYGFVWAAFVSLPTPRKKSKYLKEILFIIKKNSRYYIAGVSTYTDYYSDGNEFNWNLTAGEFSLSFERFGAPLEIERYDEPREEFNGLKIYSSNI